MATGRPLEAIEFSTAAREELEAWARRPKTAQALAQRARAILLVAEGLNNTVVAARVGWSQQTVGKWRRRFPERGLDGLLDEPRPGAHRSATELKRAIEQYLDRRNQAPKPFVRPKTADEILASLARFCTRTFDTGH